jgi:hypothetical protein
LGRRRRTGPNARKSADTARFLAAATFAFTASLFFRTIDRARSAIISLWNALYLARSQRRYDLAPAERFDRPPSSARHVEQETPAVIGYLMSMLFSSRSYS